MTPRKTSVTVALLNVSISLIYLTAYLVKTFGEAAVFSTTWTWVVYLYVYALGLIIAPSLLIWAVILIFRFKQIKRNKVWRLSAKLFALSIILHFAAFYTVRIQSNKVELTLVNDSNYPVSELEVKARNNKEFFITRLEPGEQKIIACYCARIEYPDDKGIKLAYSINGKKMEDYIIGRFSTVWDKVNISIASDSAFAETHHYFKD